jgi:hypothetical protein
MQVPTSWLDNSPCLSAIPASNPTRRMLCGMMRAVGKLLFVGANFNRAVVARLSCLTLSTLVQTARLRM